MAQGPGLPKPMQRCGTLVFVLASLAMLLAPLAGSAVGDRGPILVIVHKQVPVEALSADELRSIFQTKNKTWPDGTSIKPFNLTHDHPLRQAFDLAALGFEPEIVGRYWIDRRIRGGDRPPGTVSSPSLMVRVVAALAGAIGYAEPGDVDSTVKIVGKIVGDRMVAP